jgi:hypothetical protein
MSYLARAIQNLKPGAEFSFIEEDYSTIKWDVLEGTAPTPKAVNDEIKAIKAAEENLAATAGAKKAALLERLQITEEELRLLLS